MRKSVVSAIAAAALIAGAGLATAQQTNQQPNMAGDTAQSGQNQYQTPGAENPSASQSTASGKQGRSAMVKKHHYGKQAMKKHHYSKQAAMKGTSQGRSAVTKKKSMHSFKTQPSPKMSQPSSTY